ncbi:hypothetical protein [Pseudoflavitalea rhizosphaerae]|uniref:hypothetical protein n=1 Tax=Pseudoflavitalea rhizosphaerae TaxID=1884793 RepID=UPI000F8EDF1F|nr:hypothetical protein [Pseudoflavitalea rhizosphaerae]
MIAIFLLACFAFITFLPLAHSHFCNGHIENVADDDSGTVTPVCKLCDQIAQQNGKEFFLTYPPRIIPVLPAPIEHNGVVCAGIYEMTLNAFTNKGPPALA